MGNYYWDMIIKKPKPPLPKWRYFFEDNDKPIPLFCTCVMDVDYNEIELKLAKLYAEENDDE